MMLKDIQRTLLIPSQTKYKLLLMGAIAYRGIGGSTRSTITKDSGGHYVAYAYRRGNTSWMVMDDLKSKCAFVKDTTKIVPRMLMYIKK